MITVDLLMSTKPCPDWPRARVEALLARPDIDCSSWVRFAESCLAVGAVSVAELRITAYRAATPSQRLVGVRRSVRVMVEAQTRRWPDVSADVAAVRADLLRWCAGEEVDVVGVRHRADAAAYYAAAYAARDAAAAAAAAYAADAAADAAADSNASNAAYAAAAASAADAAGDAAAYAADARAGLLYICDVLDRNLTDDGRPDELALCERAQRGCR